MQIPDNSLFLNWHPPGRQGHGFQPGEYPVPRRPRKLLLPGRPSAYDDEIVKSTIVDIVVKSEAIRQLDKSAEVFGPKLQDVASLDHSGEDQGSLSGDLIFRQVALRIERRLPALWRGERRVYASVAEHKVRRGEFLKPKTSLAARVAELIVGR